MNRKNEHLNQAKRNKKDEFYTQLIDIENELRHYKKHFKNKVIYCNCDDPRISNFSKYFTQKFHFLGLKKLITTCYKNKNHDSFSQHKNKKSVGTIYQKGKNDNSPVEEKFKMKGDGDFRNEESIKLLKQADIVATNPPFSLFRDYVAQLIEYDKKFIILGNMNAITYKEIFPLIKENKLWIGNKPMSTDILFDVPQDISRELVSNKKEGSGYKLINGVVKGRAQAIWFTNLDIQKQQEDLILYKTYNPKEYPKYNNYDAINVDKIKNIPKDYDGVMGIPISFLDKYNPKQFEIVGITSGRDEFEATPTKRYVNVKQVNKDGSIVNGSKANTRATLLLSKKPNSVYYIADNVNGYLTILYARILIKNKKVNI